MKETDLVNLNVKVPREVRDRAKEMASRVGMKLAPFICDLIKVYSNVIDKMESEK